MLERVTTRESARPWMPAQLAGAALTCLAVSLLPVGNASARNCELKLVGATQISTPPEGPVLVHLTINGHPVSMELDTASTGSMIQAEYVQPLGLLIRPAPVQRDFRTDTQTFPMNQFVRLTSMEAGTAKFRNSPVWVLPAGARPDAAVLGTPDRPDVGRLGMDVLGDLDFELDLANSTLSFYSTDHCPGAGVHWTRHYGRSSMTKAPRGNLLFPVTLDGKKVEAIISPAAPRSWMLTYTSHQLYGPDQTADRDMTLSGLGPDRRVRVRLDSRSVDPTCSLTSRDTGAVYFLGKACRGDEPALYIGMDVLRHLHIYYAVKEQVLYYTEVEATQ